MSKTKRDMDPNLIINTLYRYIKKKIHIIMLFIMLLFAAIITIMTFSANRNPVNSELNATFKKTWQYSIDDMEANEILLPDTYHGKITSHLTLKNIIPDVLVKGATVLVRTSQQHLAVYIDNEFLYSSYDAKIGITKDTVPSSAYHFVRLPTDSIHKEITIVLASPFERYAGFMNEIYIGSKASHVFFLFELLGFRFIIGLIVFVVGIILAIAFIFTKKQSNTVGIINLGCFFICTGFWVLSESKLLQFIIPYPTTLTNLSIFALSLIPVCSGLYYFNIHVKHFRTLMKATIAIAAIISAIVAFLSFFYILFPLRILPILIFILGIYAMILVTVIVLEYFRDKKTFVASVWGVTIFGACALIELILYFHNIKERSDSYYFTIGLFLFCVMMVVDLSLNFTKAYQSTIIVNTLTTLAYTDSLTGLYNHTSFLEKLPNTQLDDTTYISLAVFDINNLKIVNDTKGHIIGDAMIKHCATVLRNSVRSQDNVYRIGGDEFAVIMYHDERFDPATIETRLKKVLEQENTHTNNYHLSIAYGYATFSKSIDSDLFATFARADKNMYDCKKSQKCVLNNESDADFSME